MISAREAALLTLYDVFYGGAYSNLALKETLGRCGGMSAADKGLVTSLVYGVVSRHFTLEYVICRYSSLKPRKLAKYIRLILELGLYQLIYADRIPQSAAVNESVKLAKKYGRRGSERFVNGVLRAFCRDGCVIEYPDDRLAALAVKESFSPEMTELFVTDFGYERAARLMAALNGVPPMMLRANILKNTCVELTEKLGKTGIRAVPVEGTALTAAEGFDVGASALYCSGCFTPQDMGAYTASVILDPQPGETVIDMCAAPGGKSTHIAELMGDSGRIIACDIHKHKLKIIENNAGRLGLNSIETALCDGSVKRESFTGAADRVLCDVPCSGWGIIRRKPDIKLGRGSVSELPTLQKAILCNGADYVKSGGTLVYSTCTINRRENEAVTDAFLNMRNDYEKTYEKTFMPDEDNSDGFYICRMIRK